MNARLMMFGGLALVMLVAWISAFVIWRAAEIGELVAPIEERGFTHLAAVTVGTGGSYENPERMGPTTAVGWAYRIVLVDAGRGVCEALRNARIPLRQPSIVFLTNLLPLNTVGLDDLLYTSWQQDREAPLRVVGPPGTRDFVAHLRAAHAVGATGLGAALPLPEAGDVIQVTEVVGNFEEEIDGVIVRGQPLPGGPVPALAWRFERGRKSIVISGTGWAPEALEAFAKDTSLLIHEGVYIPRADELEDSGIVADPKRLEMESALHTRLQDVGGLAARAGVEALALVRLKPPPWFDIQIKSIVANDFKGHIYVPEDGSELSP
jgi:ribonuclease BN (tRNA processing enzyme)